MASRRVQRLRKEYLYRKSLEGKEAENAERKARIKAALAGTAPARSAWLLLAANTAFYSAAGKSLPTESRKDAQSLLHEIELEDDVTAAPKVRFLRCYSCDRVSPAFLIFHGSPFERNSSTFADTY